MRVSMLPPTCPMGARASTTAGRKRVTLHVVPMLLQVAALTSILSCRGGDTASSPTTPQVGSRVVVLVLDGIRLEESLGDGYSDVLEMSTADILPKVRDIIDNHGVRVEGAMATGVTITAPGHSDLLTGLRHSFANYPADDGAGAYLPEFPSLLAMFPEGEALLATNSALVTPLHNSLSPHTVAAASIANATSDRNVFTVLREHMTNSALQLVVANLHQADSQGHSGPVSGYGDKVLDLDASISSFWSWIQSEPGWQDETTLVLVADHGRHRSDNDSDNEDWRDHGDHCTGCREIPMALIGAQITPGAAVSGQYTLEDLGQTIAHLLDVDLPYGTGRVIDEALLTPSGDAGAVGAVMPAAADGLVAWEERTGALAPRAAIQRDGVLLSDPDAFAAEAPVMVAADQVVAACWRELHVDESDWWPWIPRCQLRDDTGTWQDIGGPTNLVSPLWEPALAIESGQLLAAWADNSSGVVLENSSRLVLSRRDGSGWHTVFSTQVGSFPADPALIIDGSDALLAAGVGEDSLPGRSSRRIDLHRINTTTGAGTLELSVRPAGADKDGDFRLAVDRLEHPALHRDADGISLAFISYTLGTSGRAEAALWQTRRTEQWSDPVLVDTGVIGHITPVFDREGVLHWVRLNDGAAAWCAGSPAACTELGAEEVRGLAVDGDTVLISVLGEQRVWSLQTP